MKEDIIQIEDIKLLVDTFYDKVRQDDLLAPIFNERIQDRWPAHLQKMYTFWQTVLIGPHTYFGSPFPPHAVLPVDASHFQKWMDLFVATIDDLFEGKTAEEAKWRAAKMAEMFQFKIANYRTTSMKNLV